MASHMAVKWTYVEKLTRSLIVDLFDVLECLIKLIFNTNAIVIYTEEFNNVNENAW